MEVNAAILGRRSIRSYKPDPVSDEVLGQVLEAARQAPSWANTQCCRLVVVRDPEIKAKLADTLFAFSGKPSRTVDALKVAPVAIAFCAEMGLSGFTFREPRGLATDKGEYWYMYDVALAMENLALSACSFGLGTVIIGAFDNYRAAELLQLPENYSVVTLTPLGYPDETPEPRPRKDISEIVSYDRFGSTK